MNSLGLIAQAVIDTANQTIATDSSAHLVAAEQSPWMTIAVYGAIFIAIIYFMMIRPQKKQQEARQALINSIKAGDRVMTTSGIFGTISKVNEKTVMIEIANNTSIEIVAAAIAEVIPTEEGK